MANTINLGSFPTSGGSLRYQNSIYLGNNRFFRLVSQTNPNRTIAVLSESTDVFSDTQTLTNVHEQVIFDTEYLERFKMEVLDNGDIFIVGDKESRSGNLNTVLILRFNDTSGQFEIVNEYDIAINADIYNTLEYVFKVYDNDKFFLAGETAGWMRFFVIKGLSTGTISYTEMYASSLVDTYFTESSSYIKLIGDKLFCAISSDQVYQGHLFDMANEAAIYNNAGSLESGAQLDTDRYVSMIMDSNAYLYFRLNSNEISSSGSASLLGPVFDVGLNTDDYRMRDIIPLDRQHFIYFIRYNSGTSVYAKFIKIIDENYGFVSDNSTGNGIFVCNITGNNSSINSYHNGRFVHQLSTTQFWIQTNTNEFTFLTMSTS